MTLSVTATAMFSGAVRLPIVGTKNFHVNPSMHPTKEILGWILSSQRNSNTTVRSRIARDRWETVEEDIAIHLHCVWHLRIVILVRIMHSLFRTSCELTDRRIVPRAARANIGFDHNNVTLVSSQPLRSLVNFNMLFAGNDIKFDTVAPNDNRSLGSSWLNCAFKF